MDQNEPMLCARLGFSEGGHLNMKAMTASLVVLSATASAAFACDEIQITTRIRVGQWTSNSISIPVFALV
jgi:hypothetical protein